MQQPTPDHAPLTLDNGLRVLVMPVPSARSVSLSVYVAAGARYEAAEEDAGLSHFVEHLLFKGTERRPRPYDIASEIDAVGGSTNASTEQELTVYYAKVTPEHAERALDVLADVLRNSLLRDADIERERSVILEELAAIEDSPDELAGLALDGLLWPHQPLGRDIAGTPESVQGIPPERLRRYYHEQYVATAAVISIAGAIEPGHAHTLVAEALGDWTPGEPTSWVASNGATVEEPVRLLTKDSEQVNLSFGVRGLSTGDTDRYALDLLSMVLGDGMSSRLFTRLREELGLCYDVHTFVSHLRDTGSFGIFAAVDPKNAVETVREIASELRRIREGAEPHELERAKAMVRSRIQLQMEDTRAVSAWYGARAALDLELRTPETTVACFEEVTSDDLTRVAQRLLRDDALRLAAVGPVDDADALRAELRVE